MTQPMQIPIAAAASKATTNLDLFLVPFGIGKEPLEGGY